MSTSKKASQGLVKKQGLYNFGRNHLGRVTKVIAVVVAFTTCAAAYSEPLRVEIVTRILPSDPQEGMKSTQVLLVDFEKKQITQSFSTGVTGLGPIQLGSVRDKFVIENPDFSSPGRAGFTARGQTASGVLFMPNINYMFQFVVTPTGKGALSGCHDGYPAYQVMVGTNKVYDFKHRSIALLKLFGQCDIEIKNRVGF
ncbi:hypothetical protein SAMN05216386_1016 [Nitrosospira briensis]|uniref:Uncharacterized protein n=2 Tax=Nitrosospira briensis TaxID=35799 RepID=A0A1I4Z3Z0_9PROT|nr:hypothetical protein SAMN05216386_1016 [Nitrosospira briensis]